jgi:hypothetical protein
MTTIYMPLMNEGVEVWRPVEAEPLGGEMYRITGAQPPEEEWAFAPGRVVRCAARQLSGGECLVAIELAN